MLTVTQAARFWRTARHLKAIQVGNRIVRRFRPVPVDCAPAPSPAQASGHWLPCARAVSMTGPQTFRFLAESHELVSPADWDRPDWPRLWRYNLHYFDDLLAHDARARSGWHRALLARWIAENPPAGGSGWEPYCLSLRIVNWIKWSLSVAATGSTDGEAVIRSSLATQVRALHGQLEYHLLGNHLWANAKALMFAGCYFEGPEAARWRLKGEAILRDQVVEQILPDGGHFERSPMYHAIALEDVLDLLQLAARYPGRFSAALLQALRQALPGMRRWLAVMSHPDGEIALFNDAAIGIAPNLEALQRYASQLGFDEGPVSLRAIEHLRDSGYVRLCAGDAVVLMDVGPVGPDYLPGHAHADTLSFEWSLGERRVLVNGGTSTYVPGAQRQAERGTAMHNTVVVGGQDSSEVWGGFRTGRRARPVRVNVGRQDDAVFAGAAHDGYRHLPGRPVHARTIALSAARLVVTDRIETGKRVPGMSAEARFRFRGDAIDPAIGLSTEPECFTLEPASWHPGFGLALPATVANVAFKASGIVTRFTWQ